MFVVCPLRIVAITPDLLHSATNFLNLHLYCISKVYCKKKNVKIIYKKYPPKGLVAKSNLRLSGIFCSYSLHSQKSFYTLSQINQPKVD